MRNSSIVKSRAAAASRHGVRRVGPVFWGIGLLYGLCAVRPVQAAPLTFDHSMDLSYATQFSVDYYVDGYKRVSIVDDADYLVVPEGAEVPTAEDLPEELRQATVLRQPLEHIYIAATSAMDFFDCLDALETIALSGTEADGWANENPRSAMERGDIVYAGKYSAPDYETILSADCSLALESTMIYHKPEVKEKLEQFGIPVMVEHSSYEQEPLGRSEWIRLYGALLNREEEADAAFSAMEQKVQAVLAESMTGTEAEADTGKSLETEAEADAVRPTAAFFSVRTDGAVTVHKSQDYVAQVIALAGGSYVPQGIGSEDALSTVNLQMEEFYADAKDADYLIYNASIRGQLAHVADLVELNSLFAQFRAVQEGHVWCTDKSLFQSPTGLADLIVDLHRVLQGEADADCTYLYHLE